LWTPTLGYDGEGPPSLVPDTWMFRDHRVQHQVEQEAKWTSVARSVLAGDTMAKGQAGLLQNPNLAPDDIHRVLLALAKQHNSNKPVAARFQENPAASRRLTGADSFQSRVATSGVAYSFQGRPFQLKRPAKIRLKQTQAAAAEEEIQRLLRVCKAIEIAPCHDGHLPLTKGAARYEREPFPMSRWPREQPVPVLREDQLADYDRRQLLIYNDCRLRGFAPRDTESSVSTVPKSDGGHRLCTDYRRLNNFQRKEKFKLDGVPQVAEMIQPGDFGCVLDLKDCYLLMGLHPAQRRYCRFRSPVSNDRYQWKTVSFGVSEAPRICTKLFRPFVAILKSLGV